VAEPQVVMEEMVSKVRKVAVNILNKNVLNCSLLVGRGADS